jgi:hypothetical protein
MAGAALTSLLLGVLLLVYQPVPDSADGFAVLAVAASLVRHSSADIEVFAATDAQFPIDAARMGTRGQDGALYAKKGLTPSLALLPLVALSESVPGIGAQAAAMLLNPIVTTATALVVYGLILRLGFSLRTAFAVALIFALATPAMPYASTAFGEPLAGLLLVLAVTGLMMRSSARGLALAGLCGGLLVGVNTAYAMTFLVLSVWVLVAAWPRRDWRSMTAFLGAAAGPLLLIAMYNTARFAGPLETGYHFETGEGFTVNPLFGAYGMLVSPYRGLLWYSPTVLLSLAGWPALRRRASGLAWGTAALCILQVALFAAWWSWHGGVSWGPRFLIPVVPVLAVWLAPVIERSWTSRPWRIGVSVAVVLGVGVNLLGALIPYRAYTLFLTNVVWQWDFAGMTSGLYDYLVSDIAHSPLLGHLALLWGGWPLQLAWLVPVNSVALLAALALSGLGLLLVWLAWRDYGWVRVWPGVLAAPVAAMAACLAIVLSYGSGPLAAQMAALSKAMQPPGVVMAETAIFEVNLVDLQAPFRVFTANAPNTPEDIFVGPSWEQTMQYDGPFWLLTWFPACDASNWMESDLWASRAFIAEHSVEGHRAVGFFRAPDPAMREGAWQYGGVALTAYGAAVDDRGVLLRLDWRAETRATDETQWFVHLLDAAGQVVAQQDRVPQGGCRPVSDWAVGDIVTDRLYFPVADVGEGWALRVGWVGADGAPFTPLGPNGAPLKEPFILIPLSEDSE